MFRIIFLVCYLFPLSGYSQQFVEVTPLSSTLGESSGLLFLNGKIITHTDSQGEAALYEVDSITGNPSRKVVVANATNVDWEDITADSNYIYVGDFGNNGGNRTNLRIYRVSQNDYWNTPNDTVFADTLNFSFADQTDFTYSPELTNFDCEALAAINDSLYIFTKNWINAKTYVYRLPKLPGTYAAPRIDSIAVQGLITGADYHEPSNRLVFSGYTQYPFVVEMNNPLGGPFNQNPFVRYNLPVSSPIQLEAIAAFSENNYYLTAETYQAVAVRLYRLNGIHGLASTSHPEKFDFTVFPNPTDGKFNIQLPQSDSKINVKLTDETGKIIPIQITQKDSFISIDHVLTPGIYFIEVASDKSINMERLVVK